MKTAFVNAPARFEDAFTHRLRFARDGRFARVIPSPPESKFINMAAACARMKEVLGRRCHTNRLAHALAMHPVFVGKIRMSKGGMVVDNEAIEDFLQQAKRVIDGGMGSAEAAKRWSEDVHLISRQGLERRLWGNPANRIHVTVLYLPNNKGGISRRVYVERSFFEGLVGDAKEDAARLKSPSRREGRTRSHLRLKDCYSPRQLVRMLRAMGVVVQSKSLEAEIGRGRGVLLSIEGGKVVARPSHRITEKEKLLELFGLKYLKKERVEKIIGDARELLKFAGALLRPEEVIKKLKAAGVCAPSPHLALYMKHGRALVLSRRRGGTVVAHSSSEPGTYVFHFGRCYLPVYGMWNYLEEARRLLGQAAKKPGDIA